MLWGDGRIELLTEPSGADTDNIFSPDDYTYQWEMSDSENGTYLPIELNSTDEIYTTLENNYENETTKWYRCIVTSVDCGDVDITDPVDVKFLADLDAGELTRKFTRRWV